MEECSMIISFEKTSRQNVGRGRFDHSAGSRGAKKQYNQRTEIVRLPSGSIAQIPVFEAPDLPKSGFNEALVLALLANFVAWFGFALIVRALFF
jgi:hypothetical protein